MKRVFFLALCLLFLHISTGENGSRVRRYVTFPEGSTFSFAFCLELKLMTYGDVDVFSHAAAAAVNYDLPNNTKTLGVFPGVDVHNPAPATARAQRSTFYTQVEKILSALGLEGRSCVLRAICEAAQQLSPGSSLLSEALRIILMFPDGQYMNHEPKEQWKYLGAYKAGLNNLNCKDMYPACTFSIIDLALSMRPVGRF